MKKELHDALAKLLQEFSERENAQPMIPADRLRRPLNSNVERRLYQQSDARSWPVAVRRRPA